MGVLFSKIEDEGDNFDGIMVHFNYQHANAEETDFNLGDVYTTKLPDIWNRGYSEINIDSV